MLPGIYKQCPHDISYIVLILRSSDAKRMANDIPVTLKRTYVRSDYPRYKPRIQSTTC